jgi:hypothetical protein
MARRFTLVTSLLAISVSASPSPAQRSWIIYPSSFEGSFLEHPSGEYNGGGMFGGGYRYYTENAFDGVRRGYWDITVENAIPEAPNTDLFPAKPRLYFVEQWVPSSTPPGVTWDNTIYWTELPIEVTYSGPGSGEEATNNLYIPWNGQYDTNHQWIKMELNQPEGTWRQAGPGPQAPDSASCSAPGNTPASLQVWAKRGTSLYTKWNFLPPPPAHAITAVRLTEVNAYSPSCDSATYGGAVDLRCVGNADPMYFQGEAFAGSPEGKSFDGAEVVSFDGNASLAVESWTVGTCIEPGFPYNVPLTPGLPASGQYTAHLAEGDVSFQLRYDGLNTI